MKMKKLLIFLFLIKFCLCIVRPITYLHDKCSDLTLAYPPSNNKIDVFCYTPNNLYYTLYFQMNETGELIKNYTIDRKTIQSRIYLNSGYEYIESNEMNEGCFHYFIYDKYYKLIKDGNCRSSVYILKDKSILTFHSVEHFPVVIYFFKYPVNPKCTTYFFGGCYLEPDVHKEWYYTFFGDYDYLKLQNTDEHFFLFGYFNTNHLVKLYILNNNFDFENIATLENKEKTYFNNLIFSLNENDGDYIFCSNIGSQMISLECKFAKYQKYLNKIIFGESLQLLSNCTSPADVSLLNNQIFAMCYDEFYSFSDEKQFFISNAFIIDEKLEYGEYNQRKLIILEKDSIIYVRRLFYIKDKGFSFFYTSYKNSSSEFYNKNPKLSQVYIEKFCIPFIEYKYKPYEKILLNFQNYVSRGIVEKIETITILFIDRKIKLYKDDIQIFKNSEININDKIYVICEDSINPLKIKFKFDNLDCEAHLYLEESYIMKWGVPGYRCALYPNIKQINNITDHDLNDNLYDINLKKFKFSITFENEIRNDYLEIFFLNKRIECNVDKNNKNKLECIGDLPEFIFSYKFYTKQYTVNAKLPYCKNIIYLGKVKIKDKYLLNTYEIENISDITKNLNNKYNASEIIKNFSVDMISYYYWFSALSYCDDFAMEHYCCKDELLNDWEIIKHLEYRYPFPDIRIGDELKFLLQEFRPYFYNFVILKSNKYKKFIFGFPGTTNLFQLILEVIGSNQEKFSLLEPEIKVEAFFLSIFKQIYKDLFSDNIIKELKANKDYQVIFTGHSLGGALATLSSYYYADKKLADNEPVLITFGQPRVGNEIFARKFMKLIPLVFRIARKGDIVTMIPPSKKIMNSKTIYFGSLFESIQSQFVNNDLIEFINGVYKNEISINKEKRIQVINYIMKIFKIKIPLPFDYCHIGGLYVLIDDTFFQCADIYNEEIYHPICSRFDLNDIPMDISKALLNHGYLEFAEDLISKCQYGKKFIINNLY